MTAPFAGRVAVVTGAGEGIGLEIARRLHAAGASVVLNDLDAGRARAASAGFAPDGERVRALAGDASDPALAGALVAEAVRAFGRLDMAVANAGFSLFSDFYETTPAEFDRVTALNLRGSYFLAQAAARQMRAQGQGGRVLLLSSVCGHLAIRSMAAYSMSKAGVEMLVKALVPELSPHRIAINAVAPGATHTPRNLASDPDYEKTWDGLIPMGRIATPGDVASAALFLLSGEASHITGQSLVVDGGWTSVGDAPKGPGPH
jgi:3-oxoacyl-[acyl-carrier protein] reductase